MRISDIFAMGDGCGGHCSGGYGGGYSYFGHGGYPYYGGCDCDYYSCDRYRYRLPSGYYEKRHHGRGGFLGSLL